MLGASLLKSRRQFLTNTLLASATVAHQATAQSRRTLPAEVARFADPITEFPVLRFTDPAICDARLPAVHNRFLARRGNSLLYTRDKSLVCRVDTKTGVSQELCEAKGIDPLTLTATADERAAFWIEENRRVVQGTLGSGRTRTVYEAPSGWEFAGGMSASEDGLFVALVEQNPSSGAYRIRLIATTRGLPTTPVESPSEPLSTPVIRPKRAGFFYIRNRTNLYLATFDGARKIRLKTPEPGAGLRSAHWSLDGTAVDYLFQVEGAKLPGIREIQPDTNTDDRLIAPTSQFAAVHRNADASVFVGASASNASPHVLLLLRATKREFTLAEHKASDPSLVTPVFSSNSQRIFFQTDRGTGGNWAIYGMQVEKIVEETDG
ncbi:hypothetical protein F183_A36740 [Bryobacterales bacterium F-183]|nr:hypothetical protein F183_A36740 [Bryobacterales bacterium F-183]